MPLVVKVYPRHGGFKVVLWWASDDPAVICEVPAHLLILCWSAIDCLYRLEDSSAAVLPYTFDG